MDSKFSLKTLRMIDSFQALDFWCLGFLSCFSSEHCKKHQDLLNHLNGLIGLKVITQKEKIEFFVRYLISNCDAGKDLEHFLAQTKDFQNKEIGLSARLEKFVQDKAGVIEKIVEVAPYLYFYIGKECSLKPSADFSKIMNELKDMISSKHETMSDNLKISLITASFKDQEKSPEYLTTEEKLTNPYAHRSFLNSKNSKPDDKIQEEEKVDYYTLERMYKQNEQRNQSLIQPSQQSKKIIQVEKKVQINDSYNTPKVSVEDQSKPECVICYSTHDPILPLEKCGHLHHLDCLANYLEIQIREDQPVRCTMCRKDLDQEEVLTYLRNAGKSESLKKLSEKLLQDCLKNEPGVLYNCKNCGCGAFIDGGLVLFNCYHCSTKWCLICNCKWHEGLTCSEYQAKLSNKITNKISHSHSHKNVQPFVSFKSCPSCQIMIENMGGRRVKCNCGCYFCFKCGGVFDNSGSCRCPKGLGRAMTMNNM